VTLVSHSISVGLIMDAARRWRKGIEAELIDLRTLRPLDTATVIESVKRPTHRDGGARLAGLFHRRRNFGRGDR
jgi:pyruvate/2-oxoglutarate/acetoin dehydrogenase E1 component